MKKFKLHKVIIVGSPLGVLQLSAVCFSDHTIAFLDARRSYKHYISTVDKQSSGFGYKRTLEVDIEYIKLLINYIYHRA